VREGSSPKAGPPIAASPAGALSAVSPHEFGDDGAEKLEVFGRGEGIDQRWAGFGPGHGSTGPTTRCTVAEQAAR